MSSERWWLPEVFASRRDALRLRGATIRAVRAFFDDRDFAEVETPCLQHSGGMEPHLCFFRTEEEDAMGGPARPFHLHTSPELAMKKLLVAGLPRLFQLARVFRNGERSATHHPEFTMLEWYRAGQGLDALMEDAKALTRAAAAAAGVDCFHRNGRSVSLEGEWQRLSVADAFARFAGIDLLATAPDPWHPDRDRLAAEAARIGLWSSSADRWEDIVLRILMDRIEPHLGFDAPVFLHSYPVSMAALARPDPKDHRVALRFELYALGVELANAFDELTDAAEQRRRFAEDVALREDLYGNTMPVDEDFLAALERGMPQSAGCALGFDRLVMLLAGAGRIEDVLWAPVG